MSHDLEPIPAPAPVAEAVPLVVHRHPFAADVAALALPEGLTLAQMVAQSGLDPRYLPFVQIWVGDVPVPPQAWRLVRPKSGVPVVLRVIPQGGGGGGGKSPVRLVLSIAVMAAAAWVGAALAPSLAPSLTAAFGLSEATALAIGTGVIGGVVSMAGSLLINALVPLPANAAREAAVSAGPLAVPTFAITGTQNRSNQYGPIPKIYGRRRVFPVYGAHTYSETVGNDQYLRALFVVGYGPLRIEDICIGETPITAFAGVEIEVREGWTYDDPVTLYTNEIRQENLSVLLTAAGGWQERVTRPLCDEISVDIGFPRGLCKFEGSGSRTARTVDLEVQYAPVGSADWQPAPWADSEAWLQPGGVIRATDDDNGAVVRGGRWRVDPGQYAVRVRRVTPDSTDNTVIDLAQFSALRSIRRQHPIKIPGLAVIAIRIKASEQLNGTINQLSCVASSILPDWDGSNWVVRPTSNPAAAFRDVLTGRGNKRAVSPSRLHEPSLRDWAEACAAPAPQGGGARWTFDAVIDSPTTVRDLLMEIATAGRAAPGMPGGKFGVIRDRADGRVMQNYTPRNSWGYSGTKTFSEAPHGVKVRFINPEAGWQEDQVIVYADGHGEGTASLFDTLDMMACTSAAQAWREGRYHLAVRVLRPETHKISVDIEALRCNAGDLVEFSHDVIRVGLGWGRIAAITSDPQGRAVAITLDEPQTMAAGTAYGVRIRRADGSNAVVGVVTQPGTSPELRLSPPAVGLGLGDLVQFGEAGRESLPMIVKSIEPGENLSAKLTLFSAAPEVHLADQGAIPPFETGITQPVPLEWRVPAAPVMADIRSDESVLLRLPDGSLQTRIVVTLGGPIPDAGVLQVQYKLSESIQWVDWPDVKTGQTVTIGPVMDGRAYDVRMRQVTRWGIPSGWVTQWFHYVVGKTTPPPTPAGFVVEVTASGVRLRWQPVTVLDFEAYEIRQGATWADGQPVARLAATDLDLGPLAAGSYRWMIRAVDTVGLRSAEAVAVAEIVPPGAASITVQVIDNFVALSYPTPQGSHLIRGYELRRGPFLAPAEVLPGTDGAFSAIFEPVSGTRTYWVRAVDIAGNPGPWGKVAATVAQPTDYVLLTEWVSSLGGTATNAVVEGGALLAPVDTGQTWEGHFISRGWQTVQDQVDAGYPLYAQPGPGVARYFEVFDYGTTVPNTLVTVALRKEPLAGTVTVNPLLEVSGDGVDWLAVSTGWQAAVASLRYLRVTLEVIGGDASALAALGLTVSVDIKTRTDGGTAAVVSTDPDGTFVPFGVPFIDVESITLTPQGLEPLTAVSNFLDVPDPTGFRVLLFDRSGARKSGSVSWTARGR